MSSSSYIITDFPTCDIYPSYEGQEYGSSDYYSVSTGSNYPSTNSGYTMPLSPEAGSSSTGDLIEVHQVSSAGFSDASKKSVLFTSIIGVGIVLFLGLLATSVIGGLALDNPHIATSLAISEGAAIAMTVVSTAALLSCLSAVKCLCR